MAFALFGRVHEPVIIGCLCLVNDSRDRRNFAVFVTKFALYSLYLSTALLMIQEIDGTSLYVTKFTLVFGYCSWNRLVDLLYFSKSRLLLIAEFRQCIKLVLCMEHDRYIWDAVFDIILVATNLIGGHVSFDSIFDLWESIC